MSTVRRFAVVEILQAIIKEIYYNIIKTSSYIYNATYNTLINSLSGI